MTNVKKRPTTNIKSNVLRGKYRETYKEKQENIRNNFILHLWKFHFRYMWLKMVTFVVTLFTYDFVVSLFFTFVIDLHNYATHFCTYVGGFTFVRFLFYI